MQDIALQFARLERHYESALRSYDEISLLDLSHSLRIWADSKLTIHEDNPKFKTTKLFRGATPSRKVVSAVKRYPHVLAYMFSAIETYAAKGQIVSIPDFEEGHYHLACAFTFLPPDGISLKNYIAVFGEDYVAPDYKVMEQGNYSRGNFQSWLGFEVVRICLKDESGRLMSYTLSREMLIRRVANTLGGSHPMATKESLEDNRFDVPVKAMMEFGIGGLPLPYFILLKTAQEIVKIAPQLMD